MHRLYRIYRALLTPLCFVIFNGGALFLSLIWFHALNLVVRDAKKRQLYARASISYSFRLFVWMLVTLRIIKVRFDNFEQLQPPTDGSTRPGVILVANHPSLIDYVLIASRLNHINCVVKEQLKHNFFLRGVIKASGYLANDDPEAFLQEGSACLHAGEDLLIFPEGTRTSRQKEFRLRRGAAALAVHSGRPLQVITITMNTEFLTKEKRWNHVPPVCPEYVLSVGPLLTSTALAESAPAAAYASAAANGPVGAATNGAAPATDIPADTAVGAAVAAVDAPTNASAAPTGVPASASATPQSVATPDTPLGADEPEPNSLRTRQLNRQLTAILQSATNRSFTYGT